MKLFIIIGLILMGINIAEDKAIDYQFSNSITINQGAYNE